MNTFAPAPNSVQIPVGDDTLRLSALWYDLCTRNKKNRIMKRPAYDKEALRENKGGMQVGQPSAADSGNHPHPNHAGRHFRRRPHRPRIRKRNPLPAADRTGRRGGQPFGRQHGEPGLSPGRATPPGFTGHGPAGRRRTQQKTHRFCGVFQFPADGQVSEIAPRVPPKAGAAVIGTSELFQ